MFPLTIIMILSNPFLDAYNLLIFYWRASLGIMILSIEGNGSALRATTSTHGKDFVYFTQKTYFFYFTSSLLQNTHITLFILQDFSIKYSLFINFLIISLMVILFLI